MPKLNKGAAKLGRLRNHLAHRPLTLADCHAIGDLLRRLQDEGAKHGTAWREKIAMELSVSESTLTKCIRFREEYEAHEVPWLESLGLGWGRISISLGIHDKRHRRRFLNQAKKGQWTQVEMQREIQARNGSRRGGGRPRNKLASRGLIPDLCELTRRTGMWNDFFEQVWSSGRREDVPEKGRMLLTNACKQVATLQRNIRALMSELEQLGRRKKGG